MNETEAPAKIEDLFGSFDSVVDYLLPVGVLIAVVFVIIGGYMWITSAGNPDKIKQAQATLTWAIIGLAFILVIGLLLSGLVDYLAGL